MVRLGSDTSRPGPIKRGLHLMTIPEIAKCLAISSRKLYRLARQPVARNGFPAFKIRGTWYIDRDEVISWLLRMVDREQVLCFSKGEVVRRRARKGHKCKKTLIR